MLLAGLIISTTGCHTHTHAHDEPEAESFSFTFWSENIEFFLDFAPLIAGQEGSFAAHFTQMNNFKPVDFGEASVNLLKNSTIISSTKLEKPSSPGLFILNLTPPETGTFDLRFIISTDTFKDTISINNIPVYSDEERALAARPHQPEGDEITLLKEQAWNIDFEVQKVKPQPIHEVIHTSGEIQPVKGQEKILSAKTSGIVFFKSKNLQEGRNVKLGETLFSVSSKGLIQSNLNEKFKVAKARLDKTKADYERAEKLISQEIIGQKEYEQRKMDFSIAEAEFQTLTNNYNQGGQYLSAPMSGIIKNILVTDGQFVEEGTPLIEITQNRKLLLHADVSQRHLPNLRNIKSANFKTPYQKEFQPIENYNGKLVSYGNIIEENSGFIPILFELDNVGELIPGSFVELFLLANQTESSLVISKSALMEEYGSYYVYVQTGGESFEKKEVKLGINDGMNVQVLSGISEDERIVTKGVYQVKMASMSSAIPTHTH